MTLWMPASPDPPATALDLVVTWWQLYPCLSTGAGGSQCYSLKKVHTHPRTLFFVYFLTFC